MNCQKCQSIDSSAYLLAEGRRAVSLCVSCYNQLKDIIALKEQSINDWKLRSITYLACLNGSGIAEVTRAIGTLGTYKTNETNALNMLVADIDAYINEPKP